jgi:hypothetical protein
MCGRQAHVGEKTTLGNPPASDLDLSSRLNDHERFVTLRNLPGYLIPNARPVLTAQHTSNENIRQQAF